MFYEKKFGSLVKCTCSDQRLNPITCVTSQVSFLNHSSKEGRERGITGTYCRPWLRAKSCFKETGKEGQRRTSALSFGGSMHTHMLALSLSLSLLHIHMNKPT